MSAKLPAEHVALWLRIQEYSPDDAGSSFPFSARLARENGWSPSYTHRVIEEYKRFIFLALIADHPVTPPVDVDQAWHLHLVYTRSYWEHFCGRVLQRPLHHEPTKGGGVEGQKFADWYSRTLVIYERIFGHAPPRVIWPEVSARFCPRSRNRQVSDRTYRVIRKPVLQRGTASLLAIWSALALTSCASGPGDSGDFLFISFMGMISFCIIKIYLVFAYPEEPKDKTISGDKSDGGITCMDDGGCEACDGCGGCGDD